MTKTGGGKRKYKNQALEHTDTQSCPGGTMLVTWVPRRECIVTMMAIPRLQSVGQAASPPPSPLASLSPPPLFPAILRTRVGISGCGRCCSCSYPMPFCLCFLLVFMPFAHEGLRSFLDPSEPSAGFPCYLAPPELDAELLEVLLKVPHPVPLLCSGVTLIPNHLPKHRPLRHTYAPFPCVSQGPQTRAYVCVPSSQRPQSVS